VSLKQVHLLPHAAQQLRPRQATREPHKIATSRDQFRPALARIDQEQAAPEAGQIYRRSKTCRSSADDQNIQYILIA
jgi:hypothetical protein